MAEPTLSLVMMGAPGCLLIGVWAGVSGYSGWPIIVPLFFVVAGLPLFPSLAASMLIDWGAAAGAAAVYWQRSTGPAERALRFALLAWPLALGGAWIAFQLLERFAELLRGSAGWIAIVLGTLVALRAWRQPELPEVAGRDHPAPARKVVAPGIGRGITWGVIGATGFLSGMIGMSGGFNVAVVLMLALGRPASQSVATGVSFTTLVLPVAILAYAFHGGLPAAVLLATLPLATLAALGSSFSAFFVGRIPERGVGIAVGACSVTAGVVATIQAWMVPG